MAFNAADDLMGLGRRGTGGLSSSEDISRISEVSAGLAWTLDLARGFWEGRF